MKTNLDLLTEVTGIVVWDVGHPLFLTTQMRAFETLQSILTKAVAVILLNILPECHTVHSLYLAVTYFMVVLSISLIKCIDCLTVGYWLLSITLSIHDLSFLE